VIENNNQGGLLKKPPLKPRKTFIYQGSTMKLFPHAMIRISGGPFEKLESLNLVDSIQLIDAIIDRKQKLAPLKQAISDELYQVIPQQQDPALQNLLVKIRRDIFNERNIPTEKIAQITPHLPAPLAELIENYRFLKEEINRLWTKGETLFSNEVADLRGKLKTLAMDEDFRKGLLLGSQSLYKRIPGYIEKAPCARMKKKDAQTERGITRYFSRMHGKTSPFSTFTKLAVGKITPATGTLHPPLAKDQVSPIVHLKQREKARVIYHIRLNNYLYGYLKVLLTKNANIYRYLLVRPNPTIQKHEDHYLYLTNSNNIEAFQRIPANPALEVFRYLTSEKKEGIIYKNLTQAIIENEYIDAPLEDLEDFVNQLVEYGFLEFDLGVSGIDPDWDKELNKKLGCLGKELPLIKELLDTLISVRRLADRYSSSNCEECTHILEEAFQQFRAICMKLHEDAGLPADERKSPEEIRKLYEEKKKAQEESKNEDKEEEDKEETGESDENSEENQPFRQFGNTSFNFTPEKMFYEDTSLSCGPQLNEEHFLEFTNYLHQLLQKMTRFEGQFDERQKMLYYFLNKYGEKPSVDLLTFYEDYYREYKKPEALKQEALKKQAQKQEALEKEKAEARKFPDFPNIPALEERQERNKKWSEQFKTLVEKSVNKEDPAETIRLYFHHLEQTEAALAEKPSQNERDCSYGGFIQFYVEKDSEGREMLMGALNASFPGFGKMVSRFLHIFDAEVTDDIRAWNRSLQKEGRFLLEDSDASFFNANLHPPLMPYEIHIPNGQQSLPPENQVPITELQVKVDDAGSRLQLVHTPTGKRVYVFDLGFQGYMGRSQLFQLLEKFTLTEYLFCYPMVSAVNIFYSPAATREIRTIPRILYEDRIVLQRRTWYIPSERLPLKKPEETDWAWFVRVNEWRRQLGIPEEIFIFVVDRYAGQGSRPQPPGKKTAKPSPDDYKPQYISFQNPFLMELLEKAMTRVPDTLKIVEMLPNSQQLPTLGSCRHIMEFVIQWYTQEEKG
jgi:hypothetical protein